MLHETPVTKTSAVLATPLSEIELVSSLTSLVHKSNIHFWSQRTTKLVKYSTLILSADLETTVEIGIAIQERVRYEVHYSFHQPKQSKSNMLLSIDSSK